ncbi:unnamed protein product [Nezara viridula]|uniref:Aquaporin n=1 Tax=Nezara viridula TaxID=85310 RepID=A0A9P0HI98_NEZVI|nr:unnamed protein product [Nezara viridula]
MKDMMEILGTVEVTEKDKAIELLKALLAEFIGTFFITYFGCMSCINLGNLISLKSIVLIALTFGFVVMVSVQALGHVSGGHFNPAVTVGFMVVTSIPVIRGLFYLLVQSLGAVIGALVLMGVTPSESRGKLGLTSVTVKVEQALVVEFVLGFFLVLVVFGVSDKKKPLAKPAAALAVGLTVAGGHLSSIQYTGASMNPARSLGPAVVSNNWENLWVYWIGPILGGICAALLYFFILKAKDSSDAANTPGEV